MRRINASTIAVCLVALGLLLGTIALLSADTEGPKSASCEHHHNHTLHTPEQS